MSAIDLRRQGLAVRMQAIGEQVLFRGSWVPASINRIPEADSPPGEIGIQTEVGATIVIKSDQPQPKRGEVLKDDSGHTHRIGEVKPAVHGWWIKCMSESDA
jgi:hypothetical protein